MTGIDRLRTLAGAWGELGLGGELSDVADQIERELSEERDPADDVSMSAYDLLPEKDREAIAWVRDHGGLDHVRTEWRIRVPYDRYKRRRQSLLRHIDECETALRRRNERIAELEHERGELYEMARRLNDQTDEMEARLMPEGMEWPRFEDGEPVRIGDEFEASCGIRGAVDAVIVYGDGFELRSDGYKYEYDYSEHVNRPASKVFDTDGAEIRVGDTVWLVDGGGPYTVKTTSGRLGTVEFEADEWTAAKPCAITHRAPVLAADGKPLREGETVWDVKTGDKYVVGAFAGGCVNVSNGRGGGWQLLPSQLTHERPRDKCRDCRHWQRDPESGSLGVCWFLYREYEGEDCYVARFGSRDACEEFAPRAKEPAERDE